MTESYQALEGAFQTARGIAAMWRREEDVSDWRPRTDFARRSAVLYEKHARGLLPILRHLSPDRSQIAAETDREMVLFEPD